MAVRQMTYENRAFWRNPAAAGLTLFFPVLFLVIFNLIFSEQSTGRFGSNLPISNFYAPAIAAFSVINTCYTGLAMGLVLARDAGVLKRKRVTPVPTWAFLAGRIVHAVLIGILLVGIVLLLSVLLYEANSPRNIPVLLLTVTVGALAFSALGSALTGWIPNAEAAPAFVNISIWPLLFASGLFFPNLPEWLSSLADFFPVKPFLDAMLAACDPTATGPVIRWGDLAVVGLWGMGGFALALRSFAWEPRR